MKRSAFVATVTAVLAASKLPARAGAHKIYLASYSHLDASWRWPLQEGLQQADATFRSALRTLNAFPKLRFSETSAAYYRWVRTTDPETFTKVVQAVKAGRWEPLGSWWTEPDLNLVSGESLMRQAYYGRREFESAFGGYSRIAFLPDSFGSPANLPAILKAQGMTTYVPGRGRFSESELPAGLFRWKGLGNAEITTYYNPVAGGEDNPVKTLRATLAANFPEDPLVWFGLGDHGGGPSREAVADLQQYLRANPDVHVEFSRFESYFAKHPSPSAIRSGEFEDVFVGAYANAHAVKRANKDTERALLDCERIDVMSSALGGAATPAVNLDEHWESLLLNQHHDTITGMSLRESLDAAVQSNNAAAQTVQSLATRLLETIVNRINHNDPESDLIAIFNPLDRRVDTIVTYPFALNGSPDTAHDRDYVAYNSFVGPSGDDIPFQIAHADRAAHPGALRPVLLRVNIPALGYTTVRRRNINRVPPQIAAFELGRLVNEFLDVTIDPKTGQPSRLVDRRSGQSAQIATGQLRVYDDTGDTYASQGLPLHPLTPYGAFTVSKIEKIEGGPVRTVTRVHGEFGNSTLTQDWILNAGSEFLETTLRINWNEPQKRLLLVFPHSMPGPARFDVPFGTIERYLRPDARPALSYVAFPAGRPALALFGHALNAFWATPELVAINLLRSAPYAATDLRNEAYAAGDLLDIGIHELRCALFLGDVSPASLWPLSEIFQRKFPVQWVGVHGGTLPLTAHVLEVDSQTAVASARRTADGIIVRLHDISGSAHHASLRIGSSTWRGLIDAYGIATIRLAGKAWRMTNEL